MSSFGLIEGVVVRNNVVSRATNLDFLAKSVPTPKTPEVADTQPQMEYKVNLKEPKPNTYNKFGSFNQNNAAKYVYFA